VGKTQVAELNKQVI